MRTECTEKLGRLGRREIRVGFTGGSLSSDGGAVLLRLVERKTRILEAFSRCFRDHREPSRIEHSVLDLASQRVFGLLLGYEDLNDHDVLRHDPLLAVAVGKRDPLARQRRDGEQGKALASSSTLGRLELSGPNAADDRYRRIELDEDAVRSLLVERFLAAVGPEEPSELVLDLDASDLPLHGRQEGRFYHGYYREYCYLPLYVFSGDHLLAVRLQTADGDAARNSLEEVQRLVAQIRARLPRTRLIVRGDSGFCRDSLMTWCEANDVDYVLGLARNVRLESRLTRQLEQAKRMHQRSGKPERVFKEFRYSTLNSWTRRRRVIGKAEYLPGDKSNPRFVVTSLSNRRINKRAIYEDWYCPRGEMENRIKEKQLYLFGTRVSSSSFRANQIRLYLSAIAYLITQALRDLGLQGTQLARAQAHTIRTRLFKVAGRVEITARKVWVSLSSNWPFAGLFEEVRARLVAVSPQPM